MRFHKSLITFLLYVLISCNKAPKKATSVVHLMNSPAEKGSSFPYLFGGSDKTLLSWIENVGDSLTLLKYSELKENAWQPARDIARGTDWFVNWADFPAIAEQNGHMLSHNLQKSSSGTYSYDVKLNVLPKGESNWQTKLPLHTDNTPTEHGFVALLPFNESSFFVTWLDGRNTAQGGEHGEHGTMTLRAAEVSANREQFGETELDARTCDCCQTTAAITKNGPVVLYRDRSEDEVRDISIVRYVNEKWTAPRTIHNDNWQIKGCPVNGPKAEVLGNTLAVAWFTAAGEIPKVKVIFSADGGESFDKAITLNEGRTLGRVDVALIDHDTAAVSYMEMDVETAQLKVVKVKRSGVISKPLVISEMDAARSSGFPQMELVDDKLFFAWTDVSEVDPTIKMVYVRVDDF